jgi:hypothetical protein
VAKNGAAGIAFVTNQEITLSERRELNEAVDDDVDLLHLERVAAVLDRPEMHSVRARFLSLDAERPETPGPPTTREILDRAPHVPGGPDHRMLFNGKLLLQVAAVPVPDLRRHPAARDPRATLEAASGIACDATELWPPAVSLLAKELREGWQPREGVAWSAGWTTGDAAILPRRGTAAAAITLRDSGINVERTWPTAVEDDHGAFAFYAAREPEVVAEAIVAMRLAGAFFASEQAVTALDVAMLVTAAPAEPLVSSQVAVSGNRFGGVAGYIRNASAEVPSYHLDSGRFSVSEVQDAWEPAADLLGPWLVRFRTDDLFSALREDRRRR